MLLALWSGFWDWAGEEPVVTRGGVADYRAYRKQLKKIANAADKRLYRKADNRIEKLVKSPVPEIKAQAVAIQKQIDFTIEAQRESAIIHNLLVQSIKQLDLLVEQAMLREREEEELILIMALS
jgi:hypothetical protein